MSTDIAAAAASAAYPAPPILPTRSTAAATNAGQAIASSSASGGAAPYPSPVSLLDPSTGIVVLEFYNAKGNETESLPSRKQLESYRLHEPSTIHDDAAPLPTIATKSLAASAGDASQLSGSIAAASAPAQQVAAVDSLAANGTAGSVNTQA